ncbi:MAG TPA: SDR family oxidoreductase [Myxococcota bacterium]|nr:SDR family oxidoreductase [Myxococcota bacterium]
MPKPLMCDPALLQLDLRGKTYVVTGANSGIGLITAGQLAKQGARVVLAVRRVSEGEAAAAQIRAGHPPADVEVRALDLGSLASVRAFAEAFKADYARLDGLVNNAGVMNTAQGATVDGFETQLGVNHLGHFLLTALLTDRLVAAAPSRVVTLSSCYHDMAMGQEGEIALDDLNFQRRPYNGWKAYAQSKLANLLHARELARRLGDRGVTAVSVHPGWVRTNLIRNSLPVFVQDWLLWPVMRWFGMIEPWEGAQTTLHALLSPEVPKDNGAYFSQLGMYRDKSLNRGGWPLRSPNPHAHDDATAARLWDESARLVGLA